MYITRASKCKKMTKSYVFTLFHFSEPSCNFQATLLILSNYSVNLVCLGPVIIKKLEVLEQISGHKVQLKSKSRKKITSVSIMFQLPPQIVLGCSNSKWYLNLVFHPLNHILQKSGANSAWSQCDGRFIQYYTGFITDVLSHGRSRPLTSSITEPSQLHSSSAIGFRQLCTFNGHSYFSMFGITDPHIITILRD